MHELAHEFTNRKVSPWGGIKILQQCWQEAGMRKILESLDLPEPGSNRGYNPVDVIEGFMVSMVLGARRLAHSSFLMADEVIRAIFGWRRKILSTSTLSRFFSKI